MARIRTVKPDLFRHEGLFEAEIETGLPLRIAFIGLFTASDRDGRFRWLPRQLKLDVMPYDLHDFSRVLDALWSRGFIVKYAHEDQLYGCIPSFSRHQVINNRESQSLLPIPDDESVILFENSGLCAKESRVEHASITPLVQGQGEGKGREGKGSGKEGNGNSHRTSFDAFWRLYPNKKGKAPSEQIWKRLKPDGELLEKIMNGLAVQIASHEWKKDGGKYIPHPSTWLNQKRWDDEVKYDQQAASGSHRGLSLVDQVRERNRINEQREAAEWTGGAEEGFFTFDGEIVGTDD